MKKTIFFFAFFILVSVVLGRELNPLDLHFFTVHDNTQVARIQEFAVNLRHGVIPPRIAPHFSFGYGIPVFNFYAPFSYWIGGILSLIMSPAIALKLLFFAGLVLTFPSMFLLSASLFGFWAGILSASLYTSSLWMAVEIFVRGNVGEIWFLALFPTALYFSIQVSKRKSVWHFVAGIMTLSALFTTHNVLSLIALPICLGVAVLIKEKKIALLQIGIALLLSSYFLLPALTEAGMTYASDIAQKTKYSDHFLCPWQLWSATHWGFGGSGIGCINDDMSFQIGKPHIILGLIGLLSFLLSLTIKKQRYKKISLFIVLFGLSSFLMTLQASMPIWKLFAPIVRVFQFPWRFLSFGLFSVAFISSFCSLLISHKYIRAGIVIALSLFLIFTSQKFFSRPWKYTLSEYSNMFLSEKYIQQEAAYQIPEYFPRSGDYQTWRAQEKNPKGFDAPLSPVAVRPFERIYKASEFLSTIPIHYTQMWLLTVDGEAITPSTFDSLGRPMVETRLGSIIKVQYRQTPTEIVANALTLIGFLGLGVVAIRKDIWKKLTTIIN